MNTRMVAMVAIAVVLVTISAWVHLGGEQPYAPPIMTLYRSLEIPQDWQLKFGFRPIVTDDDVAELVAF